MGTRVQLRRETSRSSGLDSQTMRTPGPGAVARQNRRRMPQCPPTRCPEVQTELHKGCVHPYEIYEINALRGLAFAYQLLRNQRAGVSRDCMGVSPRRVACGL